MNNISTYDVFVGLDVHKETIAVAIADPGRGAETRFYGNVANDSEVIRRLFKKLTLKHPRLLVCYEAGPCGYRLFRLLTNSDIGKRSMQHRL